MSELPTFSQCVIGYRRWMLDVLGQLRPIAMQDPTLWTPGINEARCLVGLLVVRGQRSPHEAPGFDCGCGLYGWHELTSITNRPDAGRFAEEDMQLRSIPVIGAIAAFGRLEVHATGFRAQYAGVVALAWQLGMSPRVRGIVQRVADEYGVACVALADLEREASRHGSSLPTDVRPGQWRTAEQAYRHSLSQMSPATILPPGLRPWREGYTGVLRSASLPPRLPRPPRAAPSRRRVLAGIGLMIGSVLGWQAVVRVVLGSGGWRALAVAVVGAMALGLASGVWVHRGSGGR
jgi:hypothetical protein